MKNNGAEHSGPYRHRHRYRQRFGDLVSLLELKNGQKGVVVLLEGDEKVIRRLSELGIVPDTVIEVINSIPFGGPVEILVRGSKLVIGKDIAKGVLVRVESDEE